MYELCMLEQVVRRGSKLQAITTPAGTIVATVTTGGQPLAYTEYADADDALLSVNNELFPCISICLGCVKRLGLKYYGRDERRELLMRLDGLMHEGGFNDLVVQYHDGMFVVRLHGKRSAPVLKLGFGEGLFEAIEHMFDGEENEVAV